MLQGLAVRPLRHVSLGLAPQPGIVLGLHASACARPVVGCRQESNRSMANFRSHEPVTAPSSHPLSTTAPQALFVRKGLFPMAEPTPALTRAIRNHNQRLLQFLEASAVLRGRCRCRGSVSRVSLCAGAATVATERSPFGPRSPIRSGQLNAASDWTYAYAYRDPRARYASLTAGVEPRRFRGGPGPSAGVDREAIEDAKLRRRHRREWPDRAAPHLLRPGGLRPPTRSLVGAANLTSHPEPRWHLPHHPPGRDPSHPTHDSQPSAHPSI